MVAIDTAVRTVSPAGRAVTALVEPENRGTVLRWALILTTFAPWLLLPVLLRYSGDVRLSGRRAAYALGPTHQAATLALYADLSLRRVVAAHRSRFVTVPILVVLGSFLVFGLAPERVQGLAVVVVAAWSAFHISRQNVGVFAFVAATRRQPSPTGVERRALAAVGVAGSAGVLGFAVDLDAVGLGLLSLPLQVGAGLVTIAACVLAAPAIRARRSDVIGTAFLVQALVFYVPAYLATGASLVVIGIAHALQYFVFMAVLAGHDGRPRGGPVSLSWTRLTTFAVVATVGVGFTRYLFIGSGVDILLGLSVSASIVHYLMDAGVWRLSDPERREYLVDRFPFLAR